MRGPQHAYRGASGPLIRALAAGLARQGLLLEPLRYAQAAPLTVAITLLDVWWRGGNSARAAPAAEGRRGCSTHAPFAPCVTCVFESSAALLVAAITLLGARKARELSHVLPLLLLKA